MTRAPRVLLIALVSAWLAAAMTAVAEDAVPSLGLDGDWRLEHTENFEEYLKKSGTPWWKRKLATLGSSRLRQTISQQGLQFTIKSESPVETRKDLLVADGVTPRSAETATGDDMTWIARIEGATLVVDGHGDLGHRIARREIVDDAMVMTIENPDADTACRLYFERATTQ